jgi:hypothetical protein
MKTTSNKRIERIRKKRMKQKVFDFLLFVLVLAGWGCLWAWAFWVWAGQL